MTPLHNASKFGYIDIVKYLIDMNVEVNARDNFFLFKILLILNFFYDTTPFCCSV